MTDTASLALHTGIIAAAETADALHGAGWRGVTVLLDDLHRNGPRGPFPDPPPPDLDEAFLMLFSSGTTEPPKEFLKSRAQYAANLAVSRRYLGALPDVTTFAPRPLSFSLTLYAVIKALSTGGDPRTWPSMPTATNRIDPPHRHEVLDRPPAGGVRVAKAIVSALTLRDRVIPTTRNLTDPEFDGYDFVGQSPRSQPVGTVLSTSFRFEDHNAALLLAAP